MYASCKKTVGAVLFAQSPKKMISRLDDVARQPFPSDVGKAMTWRTVDRRRTGTSPKTSLMVCWL